MHSLTALTGAARVRAIDTVPRLPAPGNRMRLLTTGIGDFAVYEWLLKPVPAFVKR